MKSRVVGSLMIIERQACPEIAPILETGVVVGFCARQQSLRQWPSPFILDLQVNFSWLPWLGERPVNILGG